MSYVSRYGIALAITLCVALSMLTVAAVPIAYAQNAKTKYIIWTRVPMDQVVDAMGKKIDVYLFGVRPYIAKELMKRKDLVLYKAPGGIVDYILNPAPVAIVETKSKISKEEAAKALGVNPIAISRISYDSKKDVTTIELCVQPSKLPDTFKVVRNSTQLINIFCFKDIRFAVNYLIDRKFVVENLYSGLAIPMYIVYSTADPTYAVLYDIAVKYQFPYDPEYAKKVISNVLSAVGAVYKDGKWYFRGKPISVIIIGREEDERKELAKMLASELEKLGITIVLQILSFGPAITKVYCTDPMDFQWHVYTEGWGKGSIDKWDPWMVTQFAAPWFGFMPGWQESSFWNYQNETIDKLTEIIALGKFKSEEEFVQDLRKAVIMAEEEAIRIWIATTLTVFPAVKSLKGVTLNLGSGLRDTVLNLRSWYIPGTDTIRVGHMWVWTSRTVWNPYGGFSDVYSVDPMRATTDPWVWRNPFNGEPMPLRVSYEVYTAGPNGTIDVPTDAIRWDAKNDRWVYVGKNVKATSMVVFDLSKLIGTHWHNGMTITWADILGHYALLWDAAFDPEKASIESSIAASLRPSLEPIVAIKPLIKEKKLIVYINYWHFDPNYIADAAVISIYNPVEIDVAMNYLVYIAKTFAFSGTRARTANIPQLNLVLPDHAKAIADALRKLENAFDEWKKIFTLPDGTVLMSVDEWMQRIEADLKWINTYSNAWISDGPFMLVYFDKDKQMLKLEAFNDPTYPIKPDELYFGVPSPVKILSVNVEGGAYVGLDTIVVVNVLEQPKTHVLYVLYDPATGKIILKGEATRVSKGVYRIVIPGDVTKNLKPDYIYTLNIFAYSEEVTLPDSVSYVLRFAIPSTEIMKTISKVASELTAKISNVTAKLTSEINEITSSLSSKIKSVAAQLSAISSTLSKAIEDLSASISQSLSKFSAMVSASLQNVSVSVAGEIDKVVKKTDELSSKVDSLSLSIESLSKSVKELKSSVNKLNSALSTLLGLVAATLGISVVGVAATIVLRKR